MSPSHLIYRGPAIDRDPFNLFHNLLHYESFKNYCNAEFELLYCKEDGIEEEAGKPFPRAREGKVRLNLSHVESVHKLLSHLPYLHCYEKRKKEKLNQLAR